MPVTRENDLLYPDFPSQPVKKTDTYTTFEKALGINPIAVYKAVDFLVLVDNEKTLRSTSPDFELLKQIKIEAGIDNDSFGIIVTAKGETLLPIYSK